MSLILRTTPNDDCTDKIQAQEKCDVLHPETNTVLVFV